MGILQARILEWVAGSSSKIRHYAATAAAKSLQSCLTLCDPIDGSLSGSWDSPGQEYWSGLPFPPPGDFPDPGFESESPALADRFFTTKPPGKH